MPATKYEEEKESNIAAFLATLSLVNGIILCFVSILATRSGALYVIDRLVVFNAAWHTRSEDAPFVLTTRRIYEYLIFVGFLVVMSSVLGIAGAKSRNRHLVCTYVVLAGTFTVVMLAGGVQTIQRRSVVEPMIFSQVKDICNATTYMRLASSIPCKFAESYSPSELTPCGVYCRYRAGLLRQLQGCTVMPRLCQQFFYEELPPEACAAEITQGHSMMYLAAEGSERCREFCDNDIRCTAYAYSGPSAAKPERCLLGQGVGADHLPPRWSPIHPSEAAEYLSGGSRMACFRRTEPMVLARFKTHGMRLAASTMALGLVLLASTAVSCCVMYNANFKRRDLPKGTELALMMCCPCCAGETRRRFTEPDLSDDELSEGDDEEAASEASTKYS